MHTTEKPIKTHQPCPDKENCGSSDAYALYSDGHGYCFSCGKVFGKVKKKENNESAEYAYLPLRGISPSTMEKFNCLTKVVDGTPIEQGYIYPNGAVKVRNLQQKSFHTVGPMKDATLFGMDKFPAGCAKAITIVEGELDVLSAYEILGDYPVVCPRSASSAKADCAKEIEYLNSFEKVYLCFDNDEAGKRAAQQVASLFEFNKVYHVKITSPYKDVNDFLQAGKGNDFKRCWFNAKRYLPDGVISSFSEFKDLLDKEIEKESVPYHWPKLQDMSLGIRTGEVVLFTAQEGIGKTEVMRSIEHHLLKTTDSNIGIIHLEETPERTLKGLAGLELKQPCHFPGSNVSKEDILKTIETIAGRDERIHLHYDYRSNDPDTILESIRFFAASCDCKYIFLDHITMTVTGMSDKDERKVLDYVSTKLALLVKELDFCLFLVSHQNDDGKTRGSRNISNIADLHVRLKRDKEAELEIERNKTSLVIAKNRFGAATGPADELLFDFSTFTLSPIREELDENGMPLVGVDN